ncbi:MAG TPA: hypothetical protein VJB58_01730 [Candidatus Paceibacterota bacterium]
MIDLLIVYIFLVLICLSLAISVYASTGKVIDFLHQKDLEKMARQERGQQYLVCAYSTDKNEPCVVGSICLYGEPWVGQNLLLGGMGDVLICLGKITKIATVTEPEPEETVLWLELEEALMYQYLIEGKKEWSREEKMQPPK